MGIFKTGPVVVDCSMAGFADLDLDVSELIEAMRLYEQATKKDAAEIVNRAARNAVFDKTYGAFAHAPKSTVGKMGKYEPKQRRRYSEANTLFHALATEGNRFGKAKRGQGNRDVAAKTWRSRRRAFGYSRAVWAAIAKDFGARLRGKFDVDTHKTRKATPLNPMALFDTGPFSDSRSDSENAKYRGEQTRALQRGINGAAKDMAEYAASKLQERADRFSG